MRMPMKGGKFPGVHSRAQFRGGGHGVLIFLGVGAIAVAIFEVDTIVLDRLLAHGFPSRTREYDAGMREPLGGMIAARHGGVRTRWIARWQEARAG